MQKVFVNAAIAISCAFGGEPTKIIAKRVVVDQYSLRSDEVLCRGIAKSVGKAYLSNSTTLDAEKFCETTLKPKIVYPASTCNLAHMTKQCLFEIEKIQESR